MKNFYQISGLAKIMKAKREEKDRIKREFVDSGNHQAMVDSLHKKMKDKPDPSTLPF